MENKQTKTIYALSVFSIALYILITYFTHRTQSFQLIGLFIPLFIFYLWFCHLARNAAQIKIGIYISLLARMSLLFLIPNLSDDFYRFIWDGRLLLDGINPFVELPKYYIENPSMAPSGVNKTLFEQLNSQEYFTIYPPVNQLIFLIAAWVDPASVFNTVVVMRLFIITAEAGNIFLIDRLLKKYKLPHKNVLFYSLNPLIILELTGNLHFEALVIFFVLLGVYLFENNKWLGLAISMALSVGTKLLPLIFLPVLISRMKFKKILLFYFVIGISCLLIFLPLLNLRFVEGISNSFSLYFQKFEFNASIYYLVRAIGFWVTGYNIIALAGKLLGIATLTSIIIYTWWEKDKKYLLPQSFLWVLFIYLVFTTTLHPWYITPLIAYCIFTGFRFPILWSFTIFMTYLNYGANGYEENMLIVTVEYLTLFGFLAYELLFFKRKPLFC